MWTAQEFSNVLERYPEGGTLWTRSHRTVRYIRLLCLNGNTTIAVLTESTYWRTFHRTDVELFVKTDKDAWAAELPGASKTPEFLNRILEDPILENIGEDLRPVVKKFLSSPDKTFIPTW